MQFQKFDLILLKNEQEIHKKEYENLETEANQIHINCLNYNTILDLDAKTLTRENEEYEFFLAILEKSCTIHLKKENLDFDIIVDSCDLTILDNKIILEYSMETDDEKFKMILYRKDE